MRLLIDGYNLLHATDLFGAGELAGTLRGSREALIGFLAQRLTTNERRSTVIVFDSADAPPGLPDRFDQDGIDLRFARGYPDADAMIEAILEGFNRAKHLTVVSGDRRVQRAARSSGAKWIGSAEWFADLCRRSQRAEGDPASKRPAGPVGTNAHWIAEFSDPEALDAIRRQAADAPPLRPPVAPKLLPPEGPAADSSSAPSPPAKKKKKRRRPPLGESAEKPRGSFGDGVFDPFPPGYAEDLLDNEPGDQDGSESPSDR